MDSISILEVGCLYAIIAKTSNAALESINFFEGISFEMKGS